MKTKNKTSIKWKMISMILLYWAVPFLILVSLVGSYMEDRQEKTGLERLASQLEMDNRICIERIDSAISDSRQATYDRTLYGYYSEFKKGKADYNATYNKGRYYMANQFGKRKEISDSIFMMLDNPEEFKITNYNLQAGGSYRQLETFWQKDCVDILEMAGTLGTSIGIYYQEGRFYLVRNLVGSDYVPWGVLVHRLNMEYCLEPLLKSYENVWARVDIEGHTVLEEGGTQVWEKVSFPEADKTVRYEMQGKNAILYQRVKGSDFKLTTMVIADREALVNPLYDFKYIILIMILFLVPMGMLFVWLSGRYLTRPLKIMVGQAKEIEKGNLGCQLEEDTKSLEFEYLRETFNHMSKTLKYQFDHIYEEELALRDARIMALQSNINPHFMNNTLEIINWEARLGGNEKVSRMIGALSTLMDAAMDRKKLHEVTLSEEMIYVDAYLYITSQRFGNRLQIIKDLEEQTLSCKVPRLIMQPIIENAVKHGILPNGEGVVTIRSYLKEKKLILEVENNGEMIEEDRKKIAHLLSPECDISRESSLNLGIANVNQRLRILYGESCGLTIEQKDDSHVISRMCIAGFDNSVSNAQENTRNNRNSYSKLQDNKA